MRKIVTETKILTAKELFMNRMAELPMGVQNALVSRRLKVSDHDLFAFVKADGQGNISIFTKSLNEGVETNIHQGIVPIDTYFLATSIILNSAVSPTPSSVVGDAVAICP